MSDVLYSKDMVFWYDTLYAGDTKKETAFVDAVLKQHRCGSVLDVACGTGRHSFELRKKGYDVVGIDASRPEIDFAVKKSKETGAGIPFHLMDMRNINAKRLGGRFDSAICLFSAFMYMSENDDAIAALKSMNSCLKKGGILIIDVAGLWQRAYGGKFKAYLEDHYEKGDLKLHVVHKNKLIFDKNSFEEEAVYYRQAGKKKLPPVGKGKLSILRIFSPTDFDLLFRLSGFKTLNFYQSFKVSNRKSKKWKRLIVVAQKV